MLLEMAADGLGDRIAIGSRAGGLSYEALRRAASGVAERLEGTGATSLVLTLPNGPVLPVALFGAAWAGVSYAPVNFRLPEAVRAEMIERLQPAAIVDDERGGSPAPRRPPRPARSPTTRRPPRCCCSRAGRRRRRRPPCSEHDQLLAYIFNTVEFAAAGEDEAVLLAVPPFHIAGVAAVLSSTYAGRRVVPLARFDAEEWLVTAREEAVTHAFVVPTMLARIVAAMEADPSLRVPTLRHLAYGGARTPAPVLERALHLLPDAGFVNAYGLTETSSTVSVLGPDDHRAAHESDDPAVRARLSSVGRPVPGIEVVVVADGAEVRGRRPGRDPHPRGAGLGRVRRPGLAPRRRRLAAHRRPRLGRRRGLPLRRGPRRRHDHPRRREPVARRDRGHAAPAPRRSRPRPSSASPTRSGARGSPRW